MIIFSSFFIFLIIPKVSSDFSVAASKIYSYANSDDSARIFYTDLTEIAVLEDYDPANFSTSKDPGIGMLAEQPANCTCPDLRPIHSIATSPGQLKFERAEHLGTNNVTDFGLAGYLAPFPGYCNSDQIELIEFYSPILKEFRYDTSNNIWAYYADYTYFFRPVRVIGYAFYATESVWMSGSAPYIKQGLSGVAFKSLTIRFEMVQSLTKDGKTSFASSSDLIDKLISHGWSKTGTILPGPLSAQNELEIIAEKCGELEPCVEILDTRTGIYRPQNSGSQVLQGEIQANCGYFLSQNASSACFQQASQFYSYIPSYNNETAIYGNYNDGGSGNSVGFAYPYIFAFLKL